jgi:hypothetical protein
MAERLGEGEPVPVPLPGTDGAKFARAILRFTTADGVSTTVQVTTVWPLPAGGGPVPLRYNPADPAQRPSVIPAWVLYVGLVSNLFACWLGGTALLRYRRGTAFGRQLYWPPWPFK